MIVEMLLICIFAKIRGYRLLTLFKTASFYPILISQTICIVLQFSFFFKTDYFVKFAPAVEPAVILSFLFVILVYKLYKQAFIGAFLIIAGTLLNKFAIFQNGGKMPIFPSLSYCTGYITPDMLGSMDSLHILGGADTKYRFLTDFIDYGYCILSIGDVLIHMYFCIMLYGFIKAINTNIIENNKNL